MYGGVFVLVKPAKLYLASEVPAKHEQLVYAKYIFPALSVHIKAPSKAAAVQRCPKKISRGSLWDSHASI